MYKDYSGSRSQKNLLSSSGKGSLSLSEQMDDVGQEYGGGPITPFQNAQIAFSARKEANSSPPKSASDLQQEQAALFKSNQFKLADRSAQQIQKMPQNGAISQEKSIKRGQTQKIVSNTQNVQIKAQHKAIMQGNEGVKIGSQNNDQQLQIESRSKESNALDLTPQQSSGSLIGNTNKFQVVPRQRSEFINKQGKPVGKGMRIFLNQKSMPVPAPPNIHTNSTNQQSGKQGMVSNFQNGVIPSVSSTNQQAKSGQNYNSPPKQIIRSHRQQIVIPSADEFEPSAEENGKSEQPVQAAALGLGLSPSQNLPPNPSLPPHGHSSLHQMSQLSRPPSHRASTAKHVNQPSERSNKVNIQIYSAQRVMSQEIQNQPHRSDDDQSQRNNFQAAQEVINGVQILKKGDIQNQPNHNQDGKQSDFQRKRRENENEQNYDVEDSCSQIKMPYLNSLNPHLTLGNGHDNRHRLIQESQESGFSRAKDSVTSNKRNPISHVKRSKLSGGDVDSEIKAKKMLPIVSPRTLNRLQVNKNSKNQNSKQPKNDKKPQIFQQTFNEYKENRADHKEIEKETEQLLKQISPMNDLNLRDRGLTITPKAMSIQNHIFKNLTFIDLKRNLLTEITGGFCKNLPNLTKLDLSENRIKTISNDLNALMNLRLLRLDQNQLTELIPEIVELRLLEELGLQGNRLVSLPSKICLLDSLRVLNISENKIEKLPKELGLLGKQSLQVLLLHGNRFTSFPSSFVYFSNLQELSLEWFLYAKPPKPKYLVRSCEEGQRQFEDIKTLFGLINKHHMDECMLVIFLEFFSTDQEFVVNHVDNRQRTPLHNAALKGDCGVLKGLLQGEANPNILDKDNCTPLCLAIRDEKFDAAQILIDSDQVEVNLGGGIYGSPLHLAVVKLEIWLVKALLKKKANVNKTDCDGKTPLHFVMKLFSKNPQKCAYIAEMLIECGAKPNLKDADNWTALHIAVRKGQEKGVSAIMKLNQKFAQKAHNNNLMSGGISSPLLLTHQQFDLNIAGGFHQWTALHLAAHENQLQIVRKLLKNDSDVFQRTTNNQLPRHCAKRNYILTKYIKMAEQAYSTKTYSTYLITNQFQLIIGLMMKKPQEKTAEPNKNANSKEQKLKPQTSTIKSGSTILGYTNFVQTLKQAKKYKAFAMINDQIPRIGQGSNENDDVASPVSSSQDQDQDQDQDHLSQQEEDSVNNSQNSNKNGTNEQRNYYSKSKSMSDFGQFVQSIEAANQTKNQLQAQSKRESNSEHDDVSMIQLQPQQQYLQSQQQQSGPKVSMGPNCTLQSISFDQQNSSNQMVISHNSGAVCGHLVQSHDQSNLRQNYGIQKGAVAVVGNKDIEGNRLLKLQEDQKIKWTLFQHQDTILDPQISLADKFEAMVLIRKCCRLPAFLLAIEPVLLNFAKITDLTLQLEIVQAVAKSQQPALMSSLQKLLVCHSRKMQIEVVDEVEEALAELRICQQYKQDALRKSKLIQDRNQNTKIANQKVQSSQIQSIAPANRNQRQFPKKVTDKKQNSPQQQKGKQVQRGGVKQLGSSGKKKHLVSAGAIINRNIDQTVKSSHELHQDNHKIFIQNDKERSNKFAGESSSHKGKNSQKKQPKLMFQNRGDLFEQMADKGENDQWIYQQEEGDVRESNPMAAKRNSPRQADEPNMRQKLKTLEKKPGGVTAVNKRQSLQPMSKHHLPDKQKQVTAFSKSLRDSFPANRNPQKSQIYAMSQEEQKSHVQMQSQQIKNQKESADTDDLFFKIKQKSHEKHKNSDPFDNYEFTVKSNLNQKHKTVFSEEFQPYKKTAKGVVVQSQIGKTLQIPAQSQYQEGAETPLDSDHSARDDSGFSNGQRNFNEQNFTKASQDQSHMAKKKARQQSSASSEWQILSKGDVKSQKASLIQDIGQNRTILHKNGEIPTKKLSQIVLEEQFVNVPRNIHEEWDLKSEKVDEYIVGEEQKFSLPEFDQNNFTSKNHQSLQINPRSVDIVVRMPQNSILKVEPLQNFSENKDQQLDKDKDIPHKIPEAHKRQRQGNYSQNFDNNSQIRERVENTFGANRNRIFEVQANFSQAHPQVANQDMGPS